MARAKKLPSGSYRVLVYTGKDATGKRLYESFTADKAKEAEYIALEFQLNLKKRNKPENLTFTKAIDNYIEDKSNILSPSTIRGYGTMQRNCFSVIENLPLKKLDETIIQKQVNANSSIYSSKSISNQIGIISAISKKYKLNIDFDDIATKPKEKKSILIPSEDHMKKILRIVKGTSIEIPVILASLQGLRQSEIAACEWDGLDGNVLPIKGAVIPDEHHKMVQKDRNKSYAGTRNVILVDYTYKRLQELKGTGKMSTFLPSSILRIFKKLCKDNDIPQYTMHSLRHFHASVMLSLNVPDKYAMEILGQNSPHMLKTTYQHTFSDEFVKVNERINEHYKFLN